MTKLNLSTIKPIPGFDSLRWKQENHERIHRETAGMTDVEVREYFRQASERFRAEGERYRAEKMKSVASSPTLTPLNDDG
jgi:hypothetical protein